MLRRNAAIDGIYIFFKGLPSRPLMLKKRQCYRPTMGDSIMKKYTGFIAIATLAALPACSNYHHNDNESPYDQYQSSQYPSENGSESYAGASQGMNGNYDNDNYNNEGGRHHAWHERHEGE